jgi:hypothetical protein
VARSIDHRGSDIVADKDVVYIYWIWKENIKHWWFSGKIGRCHSRPHISDDSASPGFDSRPMQDDVPCIQDGFLLLDLAYETSKKGEGMGGVSKQAEDWLGFDAFSYRPATGKSSFVLEMSCTRGLESEH